MFLNPLEKLFMFKNVSFVSIVFALISLGLFIGVFVFSVNKYEVLVLGNLFDKDYLEAAALLTAGCALPFQMRKWSESE